MKKYSIVYADPPWYERGGGQIVRGAQRHYPLMKTEDICRLPVPSIIADDAHLYLWVTNNFLPDGLRVMESWGFRYITKITWVKDRIGLGQYFRGATEDCLFGVRGHLPYLVKDGKRAQFPTVLFKPKGEHSSKPPEMRSVIEHVSGDPERMKIELFARERVEGWDAWGNEIEDSIHLEVFRD